MPTFPSAASFTCQPAPMQALRLSCLAAGLVLAAPLAVSQTAASNPAIGRMLSAVGTVTLESKGSPPQLIGTDTELRVGDVLQTQAGSTAALRYIDGTNIQLGQRSRMTVSDFAMNAAQPDDERFVARLFTGAMRVITGLVAKRKPDNSRFSTSTATIGIRGTDFVIRECVADCITGGEAPAISREVTRASEDLAGRLASGGAGVDASAAGTIPRQLQGNAPFRAGEVVSTGASAALLVLRDGTRIALDPDSSLLIRTFEFDEASPATGRIALVINKGKVQIAAGQIARARAELMSVAIGQASVRPDADAAFGAAFKSGSGSELIQIAVASGSVALQTSAGAGSGATSTRVDAGKTITLQSGGAPVFGEALLFEAAAPAVAVIDSTQLFGLNAALPNAPARAGTFVFVNGGSVVLGQDGRELLVTPGETAYASAARGPLERVANGARVAGITALGLQTGGSDPICRPGG
jgi:hypothetical protein